MHVDRAGRPGQVGQRQLAAVVAHPRFEEDDLPLVLGRRRRERARPGAGSKGNDLSEAAFPFASASWYFLDAVDMAAPKGLAAIVAFGDSITDGTASTMNGDDRWPDVLARRLNGRWVVVNAGIGGNQVVGPSEYSPQKPFPGGPSALQRLDRDVLTLSGVKAVIWLEGTNDFSKNGNAEADAVIAGMREGVSRIRATDSGR